MRKSYGWACSCTCGITHPNGDMTHGKEVTRSASLLSPQDCLIYVYDLGVLEALETMIPSIARIVSRDMLKAGIKHLLLPYAVMVGVENEAQYRQLQSYAVLHFGHWLIEDKRARCDEKQTSLIEKEIRSILDDTVEWMSDPAFAHDRIERALRSWNNR